MPISVASSRGGQNKALTAYVQGYENQDFMGCYLSPMTGVEFRGGVYVKFDRSLFKLYDDSRAPGAPYRAIESGYEGKPYSLKSKGLSYSIPIEQWNEAKQSTNVDLGMMASNLLTEAEMLALESEQAALFTNSALYNANNTEALSGSSQWSDASSTPSADVRRWKAAVGSQIGKDPNVLLMSYSVFQQISEHPTIVDRIKHTSRDSVTAEMLAQLWDLEKVLVGRAIIDTGDGTTDYVWGKNVILARINKDALKSGKMPMSSKLQPNKAQPNFAYTYVEKGAPKMSNPYYDDDTDCWKYKISMDRDTAIVGVDDSGLGISGFLARTVVA